MEQLSAIMVLKGSDIMEEVRLTSLTKSSG